MKILDIHAIIRKKKKKYKTAKPEETVENKLAKMCIRDRPQTVHGI